MPPNDDTMGSGDAFASFLIDASPAAGPRRVAGIDDFLAVPPVPAEPPAPDASPDDRPAAAAHAPAPEAAAPVAASPPFAADEAFRAADLPILSAFSIEPGATPAVAAPLDDGDPPTAPPRASRPLDADLGDSIITSLAAGVEQGGGGDVLPALAANILDDDLLADPSALLSAASPAGPAADGGASPGDRSDPWPSPWAPPAATSPSWPAGRDAGTQSFGPLDARPGGDDRGPDASEGLEGRLSQAVARLEEAVAALSAPGPPPLGSRPRGFRGRIDA
jgi:hypothetical protein